MKKTYYIKNLDCANCALKIENEIKKLDGVSKAKVDYANEIILIESHKHYSSSDLDKLAKRIEDQVSIHDEEIHEHEMNKSPEIIINILGVIFLILAYILNELHVLSDLYILLLYMTAYIGIGGKVLLKAIKNIYRGQFFDEHFLMSIATLGAFFIGEYIEGVAVMLFYRIGEFLQDLAVSNSKKSIKALLDIKPEVAHLEKENQIVNVKPEELEKDQIIIIYPGEKIPVDGVVIEGTSAVDESKLTGESLPKDINKGMHILSGSINISGVIKAIVLETYEHSTVSRIIAFAKDNIDKKATTEKFITRFAKLYTPIVVLLAVFLAFVVPLLDSLWFSEETYRFLMPIYVERALIFLVISCPCALVLSIPLSFFSGIGAQ
ncbi:MAG: heavy metal translocating P-type ATPase, partial [Acholeplasmataceae bacterium]|nr:heavy metal translocating P-type ATPase [Acholeplasmataceae bacterium]